MLVLIGGKAPSGGRVADSSCEFANNKTAVEIKGRKDILDQMPVPRRAPPPLCCTTYSIFEFQETPPIIINSSW